MREHYDFMTEDVCTKRIEFDIEVGRIYVIRFHGGCPGNLAAIERLVEGTDAMITAEILMGNRCGHKATSCADQLAIAIEQAMTAESDQRKAS